MTLTGALRRSPKFCAGDVSMTSLPTTVMVAGALTSDVSAGGDDHLLAVYGHLQRDRGDRDRARAGHGRVLVPARAARFAVTL